MVRQILRYTLTLFALQLVFGGIAFLLLDFRWLSLPVGLIFLALVWMAGRSFAADTIRSPLWLTGLVALLIGLLWQVPGLVGTVNWLGEEVIHTAQYDGIADLMDFGMETWHTVILPLITSVPRGLLPGEFFLPVSWYYITLVAASPLLVILFVGATLLKRPRA